MPAAKEIAELLAAPLCGPDVEVRCPSSLASLRPGALVFANAFAEDTVAALNSAAGVLAIVSRQYSGRLSCAHIIAERPRLAFAKAASRFFAERGGRGVAKTAVIAKDARLAADVAVGEYCVIGAGASIGPGTRLMHHVVVGENCSIGARCLIKSHSVIGEDGFGFEREEDGTPVKLPHVGRVVIGDDVQIGCLNSIDRATFDATIVENGVKTDEQVHIGHNCFVGANTLLTACVEISGSVQIGRNVWIGPNASIIDKVRIGDGAFVGIGAVVTKDLAPGETVAGNPARRLAKNAG